MLKLPLLRAFITLPSHPPAYVLSFRRAKSSTPLKVKWYYNTDQPLSKPEWYEYTQEKEPEKFLPFSDYDNARLERALETKQDVVDVREDRLFKVDMEKMQLTSVYWTGPCIR